MKGWGREEECGLTHRESSSRSRKKVGVNLSCRVPKLQHTAISAKTSAHAWKEGGEWGGGADSGESSRGKANLSHSPHIVVAQITERLQLWRKVRKESHQTQHTAPSQCAVLSGLPPELDRCPCNPLQTPARKKNSKNFGRCVERGSRPCGHETWRLCRETERGEQIFGREPLDLTVEPVDSATVGERGERTNQIVGREIGGKVAAVCERQSGD